MADHLFLASTPFNVLTAAMVALTLPDGDSAELGLIDQTSTTQSFRDALQGWSQSPFRTHHLVSQKTSRRNKRRQRQQAFRTLDGILQDLNPQWIYTGNDRRIEFQYAMAHSQAKGVYLDDGTYSYLGKPSHWLKDQVIDQCLKKLAYGFWWRQPPTIGASSWIDHSVLAFPDSALPSLKRKPVEPLPQNLTHPAFTELANLCLSSTPEVASQIPQVNALLLLPHESITVDRPDRFGQWLSNNGQVVAYKHHPRTQENQRTSHHTQSFWSVPEDAMALPPATPMEIILPLLPQKSRVLGTLSTALLTAKWLRPDAAVHVVATGEGDPAFIQLLRALDIHFIDDKGLETAVTAPGLRQAPDGSVSDALTTDPRWPDQPE